MIIKIDLDGFHFFKHSGWIEFCLHLGQGVRSLYLNVGGVYHKEQPWYWLGKIDFERIERELELQKNSEAQSKH